MENYIIVGVLLLLIVGMFFMQARRRKVVTNSHEQMLDKVRTGTRIKTVAGVIGQIKEIREESTGLKTILLESGHGSRVSYTLFDINAILEIMDEPMTNNIVPEKKEEAEEKPATAPSDDDFDAGEFVSKSNEQRKRTNKK